MRIFPLLAGLLSLTVIGCAHEGPRTVTRASFDETPSGQRAFVWDRIDVRPAKSHRVATYRWSHLHAPRMPGPVAPPPTAYVVVPADQRHTPAHALPSPDAPYPLPPLPDVDWDTQDDDGEPGLLDSPPPPRTSWLFTAPTIVR